MPCCTVKFAHYPSYTPLCELRVDALETATFGGLKLKFFQHLLAQETSPARVFTRYYKLTGPSERHDITDNGEGTLLTAIGIADESIVLCEGPDTNNIDGIGMALSALTAEGQSSKLLTASQLETIQKCLLHSVADNAALRQENATVEAKLATLTAQLNSLTTLSLAQVRAYDRLDKEVETLRSGNGRLDKEVEALRSQANTMNSSHQRDSNFLAHRCDHIDNTCSRLKTQTKNMAQKMVGYSINGNCRNCGDNGHKAADCQYFY